MPWTNGSTSQTLPASNRSPLPWTGHRVVPSAGRIEMARRVRRWPRRGSCRWVAWAVAATTRTAGTFCDASVRIRRDSMGSPRLRWPHLLVTPLRGRMWRESPAPQEPPPFVPPTRSRFSRPPSRIVLAAGAWLPARENVNEFRWLSRTAAQSRRHP
jgi:hypothetical protein